MDAIDLFSGCGGFSSGFINAGFTITHAVEYDKMIADSYIANHPDTIMFNYDISNIDELCLFNNITTDVIIGGPPCQGFSMAGSRIRDGFVDDPRNYLFKHYLNIVASLRPKCFLMENVKGLLTMKKGYVFKDMISSFHDIGYHIGYKLINSYDFGIAQKRERIIIIGCINKIDDINILFKKQKKK